MTLLFLAEVRKKRKNRGGRGGRQVVCIVCGIVLLNQLKKNIYVVTCLHALTSLKSHRLMPKKFVQSCAWTWNKHEIFMVSSSRIFSEPIFASHLFQLTLNRGLWLKGLRLFHMQKCICLVKNISWDLDQQYSYYIKLCETNVNIWLRRLTGTAYRAC